MLRAKLMESCARWRSITEGGDTFYTEWEESFESFDQMGLHENLLRGIYAYGAALSADRFLLHQSGSIAWCL